MQAWPGAKTSWSGAALGEPTPPLGLLDIRPPPTPAQRVAAEEGSQKDGPVTVPLAQRQLSKSGFGLLEWIWAGVSRGVLVYGWSAESVEPGAARRGRGMGRPPWVLGGSPRGLRWPPRIRGGSPRGAGEHRRNLRRAGAGASRRLASAKTRLS